MGEAVGVCLPRARRFWPHSISKSHRRWHSRASARCRSSVLASHDLPAAMLLLETRGSDEVNRSHDDNRPFTLLMLAVLLRGKTTRSSGDLEVQLLGLHKIDT